MKAVVLFDNLGPYHRARLRASARMFQLLAVEVAARSAEYAWVSNGKPEFQTVTILGAEANQITSKRQIVQGVNQALTDFQPKVVFIPGWSSLAAFTAIRWCLRHRVLAVAMSETTAWDASRQIWREWAKSRIVGLCSSALVGGQPHAEYIAQLGMPPERIFTGYDAVDNQYFSLAVENIVQQEPSIRNAYGLSHPFFLASARFIEKKNLTRLIQAYARYRQLAATQNSDPWHLVLLGDGALRPQIEQLIDELGLCDSVHLPGFKQYDELPVYYGLAGAFIHASTVEQWGLVVNEAMASGLPVLVSNRCGCAADLVRDGHNGFTFDPYDIERLAMLMAELGALPEQELHHMGENSQKLIEDWGPDAFATGMARAIDVATQTAVPRASLVDRLLLGALIRL